MGEKRNSIGSATNVRVLTSDRRGSYSKRTKTEIPTSYQERVFAFIHQIAEAEKLPSRLTEEAQTLLSDMDEQKTTTADSMDGIMHLVHKDKVDHDTQDWLNQQMIQRTTEILNDNGDMANPKSTSERRESKETSTAVTKTERLQQLKEASSTRKSSIKDKVEQQTMPTEISSITFNIFESAVLREDKKLAILTTMVLEKSDLINSLGLVRETVHEFLLRIEDGYLDNPYHSEVHAADVLQSCYSILISTNLVSVFSTYEFFAILIAAVIHDYKHPGTNNQFLIQTQSDLAILYNDHAILENHHVASAFMDMKNEKYNLLKPLSTDVQKAMRSTIISLVLATDIAHHFDAVASLNEAISSGSKFDFSAQHDKKLTMELLIKVADVSNPCKMPSVYSAWVERIMNEFYRQGSQERAQNLTISAFMDEDKPALVKCQLGFIDFIVRPLIEPFLALLEKNDLDVTACNAYMRNLLHNREIWMSVKMDDQSQLKYPSDLPGTYFRDDLVKTE